MGAQVFGDGRVHQEHPGQLLLGLLCGQIGADSSEHSGFAEPSVIQKAKHLSTTRTFFVFQSCSRLAGFILGGASFAHRGVMLDQPLIQTIRPRGLLSFGPQTPPVHLERLNVLIGPNSSGKSNLFDVFRLIRSIPVDLQETVRRSGGPRGWLWESDVTSTPELEVVVSPADAPLGHRILFRTVDSELWPVEESITLAPELLLYEFRADSGKARVRSRAVGDSAAGLPEDRPPLHPGPGLRWVPIGSLEAPTGPLAELSYPGEADQSILQQLRSPFDYPHLSMLAGVYRSIQIYDGWVFGRDAPLRRSQPADGRSDRLEEDYSNLGLVLNQMGAYPEAKQQIISGLRELYEGFTNYEVVISGGSVQVYFTEDQRRSVPATRLSDGAIRYLCLLTMLYNPNALPVLCIEEPELGLHPDIVAGLAKHLVAASQRLQVVVTTHSDILVDALSSAPEAIVVFENHDGCTQMGRFGEDGLSKWLEEYRLGELWTSGQIGGTRW